MTLLQDVPLSAHTTLGLGGPARYWIDVHDELDLAPAFALAREQEWPVLVLGGGSNMVVGDEGFPGLVLHAHCTGVLYRTEGDSVLLTAEAGERWDDLVSLAVANGWAGIECLSGIPGRVGATPMQNVGAYGQEVADTLESLRAFDTLLGQVVTIKAGDCGFGYRQSRFKGEDAGRFVICSVTYRLRKGAPAPIRYGELSKALEGEELTLPLIRDTVLRLRGRKGMVLAPQDLDTRSVGSFFTNPVVTEGQAAQVQAESAEAMPRHPAVDGMCKLSAAWLIEKAGFQRGYGGPHCFISNKHTLALTHRGGGTTAELLRLAAEVRDGVYQRFGVELRPEPDLIGCSLPPLPT